MMNLIWIGRDRETKVINRRRLGSCIYIYIHILKLWYPLDAFTTAHLAVIVSYVVDYWDNLSHPTITYIFAGDHAQAQASGKGIR